jgi:uncharacterized protein (TIGR02145 family)
MLWAWLGHGEVAMKTQWILSACTALVLVACNSHELPTEWEEAAVSSSAISSSSAENLFGTMVDKNNNVHQTVKIGDLVWTTENMKYLDLADSGIVCNSSTSTTECPGGAFYRHKSAQNVCPSPWRLPTDEDFRSLVKFAGSKARSNCASEAVPAELKLAEAYRRFPSDTTLGTCNAVAGAVLKANSGWEKGPGVDGVSFRGLPEGYFDISAEYLQVGEYGYFWSASVIEKPLYSNDSTAASSWYLTKSDAMVHESNDTEVWMSVRCVRNP